MIGGERIREKICSFLKNGDRRPAVFIAIIFLFALNFLVWSRIFFSAENKSELEIYSLPVGQGDSQLVKLPGGAKLLIDGGPPNGELLAALSRILPANDRYIDLAMISHPQLDHFGGLAEVLRRYQIGLILTNGGKSGQAAYEEMERIAQEKNIRFISLAKGDKISYLESRIDILWPDNLGFLANNPNDNALVAALFSNNTASLFTGDIPAAIERKIAGFFKEPVDILKVAHHGSKNSSAADFLGKIRPKLALIGVGKNSYGHPTPEVLERLAQIGSAVYRTDQDGIVKISIDGRKLEVFRDW